MYGMEYSLCMYGALSLTFIIVFFIFGLKRKQDNTITTITHDNKTIREPTLILDLEIEQIATSKLESELALESKAEPKPIDTKDFSFKNEMSLKLNLAKLYIEIEDFNTAKDLLQEISSRGNEEEQREAKLLLNGFLCIESL